MRRRYSDEQAPDKWTRVVDQIKSWAQTLVILGGIAWGFFATMNSMRDGYRDLIAADKANADAAAAAMLKAENAEKVNTAQTEKIGDIEYRTDALESFRRDVRQGRYNNVIQRLQDSPTLSSPGSTIK